MAGARAEKQMKVEKLRIEKGKTSHDKNEDWTREYYELEANKTVKKQFSWNAEKIKRISPISKIHRSRLT